mmetsp:Transcript_9201/g.11281  ORF Transcript_9201/g.11281 Transcript_9201/m.11281 type:complete len:287 (-) Transcript_9201:293-1153(-)
MAVLKFAQNTCDRLAKLAAEWLRVGYCQGNFNSDNCHIGGLTLDYGPMGYMEKYDRGFAKWVGSGDHFAFAAQPRAAQANFATLARSLIPIFHEDENSMDQLKALVEDYSSEVFQKAIDNTFLTKLGFSIEVDKKLRQNHIMLWKNVENLLQEYEIDYTIFFRALSERPLTISATELVEIASYSPLSEKSISDFTSWLQDWRAALSNEDENTISKRMIIVNPKYVLRESMFVNAYEAAFDGDLDPVRELYTLIKQPYTDQGPEMNSKYYKKAASIDLSRPGTAFMT